MPSSPTAPKPKSARKRAPIVPKPGSSASLLGGRAPSKRGDTAGSRRSGMPRHPVACYTGGRDELRFRPPAPQNLQNVIPRQRKVSFNTSVTSPLLQQYLEQEPMMKRNSVIRTSPVHWCYTGGTETFVKTPSSREIHDGLQRGRKRERNSQLQRLLSRPFSTRFG